MQPWGRDGWGGGRCWTPLKSSVSFQGTCANWFLCLLQNKSLGRPFLLPLSPSLAFPLVCHQFCPARVNVKLAVLCSQCSLDLINIFYQCAAKDEEQRRGLPGLLGEELQRVGGIWEESEESSCHVSQPQDRRIYHGFKSLATTHTHTRFLAQNHFASSSLFQYLWPSPTPYLLQGQPWMN